MYEIIVMFADVVEFCFGDEYKALVSAGGDTSLDLGIAFPPWQNVDLEDFTLDHAVK